MMASKPQLVFQAVTAALQIFPHYTELLIATAPTLPEDVVTGLGTLPNVRCVPGTASVEEAGQVRFGLMDAAIGDWIVNIDDDDVWCYPPEDLRTLPDNVGFTSGGVFVVRLYGDLQSPHSFASKRSRPMRTPTEATVMGGSFWAVRRKAWQQISPHMDRSWWFSDWRMAYTLRYFGWKFHSNSQVLGLVRSYDYDYPSGPQWEWMTYAKSLEEQYRRKGLAPREEPLST